MILSEPETLLLIRISIETHSFTLLESILQAELFVPSLGVGLEFEKTRGLEQLALHVYHVGRIVDKIITLSISIDRFRDAAHGILVAYPRDEINGVLCDLHAKFGRISIAKVLVNLVILMEYDGMTVDSQGFYNQVGTLMALGAVESRSDFLMKLGEIADS